MNSEEQPYWECVSGPRLKNQLTGEMPVVAHGNGHTGRWFLSAMYSEMKLLQHLGLSMEELKHLQHEMPVPPGTEVTEEIKAEYCPWWYMPGMHKGATDGFATFRSIREMLCGKELVRVLRDFKWRQVQSSLAQKAEHLRELRRPSPPD